MIRQSVPKLRHSSVSVLQGILVSPKTSSVNFGLSGTNHHSARYINSEQKTKTLPRRKKQNEEILVWLCGSGNVAGERCRFVSCNALRAFDDWGQATEGGRLQDRDQGQQGRYQVGQGSRGSSREGGECRFQVQHLHGSLQQRRGQ